MTAPALPAIQRELERELVQRRGFYPGRVASGNMRAEEAERQLALAGAWSDDIARLIAHPVGRLPAPAHGLSWWNRHQGLLRELAQRAHHYPKGIAEGRLLEADAAHRIACLDALLVHYQDGPLYEASNGALPRHHSTPRRTPAEAEARIEWLQMQLHLSRQHGGPIAPDSWTRELTLEGIACE